ncbi:dTDP-4-dehydrorhamnose reductase [Paenibacillus sp. BK033]|uniref:dTDP-4-dehydrorhamnose reductase n=1 Tax=Paenibacillus sp. BK033 TaxID=2512133 RepID=UPI00104CF127|nr:dTDP-4-dehydrorhamnose reductase [Paenibacillus sp. BK033]TCM97789.1 dTDP-4-dehydrorhamnose reductase [Paenibacillus sp. BK033]
MKILVTGAHGQLGHDVVKLFSASHEVLGLGRKQLDISNEAQCVVVFEAYKPDVVIHCAAFTNVDLAESKEELAFKINEIGTWNIARASSSIGAKLCYISTDYVFDGRATKPYEEHASTNPQSVYGKSKRAGEQAVQMFSSRYFIVRTSWVYGRNGNNFVKTMLKLAQERERLEVVHDQFGSPTYTMDLAHFLLQLIHSEKYGIYHASNTGICSWYDLALAIMEESGFQAEVKPCSTKDFPRPAPRPRYSAMAHTAIHSNGFEDFRPWRKALEEFLKSFGDNGK